MHRSVRCALVAGLLLAVPGLAVAQPPAADARTAEQVYKNIKVLQGTPANQLNQSMHLMKGAVGIDCLECESQSIRLVLLQGRMIAVEEDSADLLQLPADSRIATPEASPGD